MCRGFPVWLKYVPGISFRTDNEPFKVSDINLFIFFLFFLDCKKHKWTGLIFLLFFFNLLILKAAMQGFTQKIVQMMKSENLFESQGGPIILSQVLSFSC